MELCDADANGAEVAQYEVFLRKGKIMLCNHHLRESWPAFGSGVVALKLDSAVIANVAYRIECSNW